ncbi:MAG: bifunctional 4-hydroxy-2-oxoglutarate aldolase/2-dehydro-3-deoxy-phosphogluconate aldolase [Pseudomonadota bacterium]
MTETIFKRLEQIRVVPLVQADDPKLAAEISEALIEGGLGVLEVVLRTDAALKCLEAVVNKFPDAHVGAGTVLSATQSKEVIARGASFIVSPGLDEASVGVAQSANIPIFPGVATPSEVQRAWNLGLRAVKFFPAGLAGGPKMLKAFSSVFRDMRFMPTGGVTAANLADFLEIPSVLACGGSWLTPQSVIDDRDFAAITNLACEAKSIARQ